MVTCTTCKIYGAIEVWKISWTQKGQHQARNECLQFKNCAMKYKYENQVRILEILHYHDIFSVNYAAHCTRAIWVITPLGISTWCGNGCNDEWLISFSHPRSLFRWNFTFLKPKLYFHRWCSQRNRRGTTSQKFLKALTLCYPNVPQCFNFPNDQNRFWALGQKNIKEVFRNFQKLLCTNHLFQNIFYRRAYSDLCIIISTSFIFYYILTLLYSKRSILELDSFCVLFTCP